MLTVLRETHYRIISTNEKKKKEKKCIHTRNVNT